NEAADIVPPDTDNLKASGTLKVLGAAKQFAVFVDGKRRGTTPCELELEAGDHLVVVVLDNWRQSFNMTVKNDETTVLHPRPPGNDTRPAFQGIIRFDIPSGYRVTLDGINIPAQPRRLVFGTYGVDVHDPKTGRHKYFSVQLDQSNPVVLIRYQ
ncbi:MAG: PEGA domain-containing protein, partial [Myxococcota bacterium]|nr:PEGA domain-containing protein [Myxococcota bacterium]